MMQQDDLAKILDGGDATAEHERPTETVLVIDDDETIRSALSFVLGEKYRVASHDSAIPGVEAVDDTTAVVILDIKMQGHDGFWAYQAIRDKNDLLPIIFHSAYQDLRDPYEIMNEFRPFGYLTKQGDVSVLMETVDKAIAHYRMVKRNRDMTVRLRRVQAELNQLLGS